MKKFAIRCKGPGLYGLALILFLHLSSCQEDDPTPTELLTGLWELEDYNGDELPISPDDVGLWDWEFEENGDFEWLVAQISGSYGIFFQGEWEFGNAAEDELIIEYAAFGGDWELEMDIDEITSTRLVLDGTVTITNNSNNIYTYNSEFEFDRVQ